MKCPIDDNDLLMTDRQGIEIDYCPKCRGVWLDRGELDKIIERAAMAEEPPAQAAPPRQYDEGRHAAPRHYEDRRYSDDYRRKKRKSLLGEIFDF